MSQGGHFNTLSVIQYYARAGNLDTATDIITAWSGSNCQVVSHAILGSRWANRAISLLLLFRLQDNKLFKTNAE